MYILGAMILGTKVYYQPYITVISYSRAATMHYPMALRAVMLRLLGPKTILNKKGFRVWGLWAILSNRLESKGRVLVGQSNTEGEPQT